MAEADAREPDAIRWLLLRAKGREGSGTFGCPVHGDQCAQISTDVLRVLPPASCLRAPTGAGSNDARPRDRLADVALQYEKLAEGAEAGYHNPE